MPYTSHKVQLSKYIDSERYKPDSVVYKILILRLFTVIPVVVF